MPRSLQATCEPAQGIDADRRLNRLPSDALFEPAFFPLTNGRDGTTVECTVCRDLQRPVSPSALLSAICSKHQLKNERVCAIIQRLCASFVRTALPFVPLMAMIFTSNFTTPSYRPSVNIRK